MGDEQGRGVRVPLLEAVELGTRETDLSPGIGLDCRAVLRDERVLYESHSFPTVATLDDDGQVVDTFIADDGGLTTFTDRRLIFVRDNPDAGQTGGTDASDDEFVPLTGAFVPPIAPPVALESPVAPVERVVTVVAGHVRWASVTALSYHRRHGLFGSVDVFYVSTRTSSSTLLIAARVKRAPNDLCPRVVESISIARRVEIPAPAGRPDGSMSWVF